MANGNDDRLLDLERVELPESVHGHCDAAFDGVFHGDNRTIDPARSEGLKGLGDGGVGHEARRNVQGLCKGKRGHLRVGATGSKMGDRKGHRCWCSGFGLSFPAIIWRFA